MSNFSRPAAMTTGRLDWRHELERCAASRWAQVSVPVYLDGSKNDLWTLRMSPAEYRSRL